MSGKKQKHKFKPLDLGPLPVDEINETLELELEAGEVFFSVPAQRHAAQDHPQDFLPCLPFLGATVSEPTYAGDDFKNPGKFELVRRMPDGRGLLVAVAAERDKKGRYHVCSMYPIPQSTIDQRRHVKHLRNVIRKKKSPTE